MLMLTDFRSGQFPDDKDGYGPQNVGLLAIQQPDMAASSRAFILHEPVSFSFTGLV
jgi:hypothetical protein